MSAIPQDAPGDLSQHERARLAKLEAAVDDHVASFARAGAALDEIREQRLYRQTHDRFDDYCREHWGFTAGRARQLIRAARAVTAGNARGACTEREARAMLAKPVDDLAETEIYAAAQDAYRGPLPIPAVPEGVGHLASRILVRLREGDLFGAQLDLELVTISPQDRVYIRGLIDSYELDLRDRILAIRDLRRGLRRVPTEPVPIPPQRTDYPPQRSAYPNEPAWKVTPGGLERVDKHEPKPDSPPIVICEDPGF